MFFEGRIFNMRKTIRKFIISFSLILFVVATPAYHAAAEPVWINPPLLYEIKDYPDTGYFQILISAAVNQSSGELYILSTSPDAISIYDSATGIPRRQIPLKTELMDGDAVCKCGDTLWLIHNRLLYEVDDRGELLSPWDQPTKMAPSFDGAICDRLDYLFLFNSYEAAVRRYSPTGELSWKKSSAEPELKKGVDFPVKRINDATVDYFGRLFVLDSELRRILPFSEDGRPMVQISGDSFSDVPFPYDSPTIAIDSDKKIWMLNTSENTLDGYNMFGGLDFRIDSDTDMGPRFLTPEDIFIDEEDRLYVIDSSSSSVLVFDLKSGY